MLSWAGASDLALLAAQASPAALEELVERLDAPEAAVRARAACEIARLAERAPGRADVAIPALLRLLGHETPVDPRVCHPDAWWWDRGPITPGGEAAGALVCIGRAAFDPLVGALEDGSGAARARAAWALGALDDRRGVPPLIETLGDEEPRARRQAAWALGALDDRRAVEPLAGALEDEDAEVREQAAWALGAIGDPRATDALVPAVSDPDARVRRQAVWALGVLRRNDE